MLLDAMTGEPEWCGALAAVSLHRQTLKKGEEEGKKSIIKTQKFEEEARKRTTTGG